MFDYKAVAENLAGQSCDLVPVDFSYYEKRYIEEKLYEYGCLAGEALNDDYKYEFSDETKEWIVQILLEWTFHKLVDLRNGRIPMTQWDLILQKIAFTLYEVAKQGCARKDVSKDQLIQAIEYHVSKVYEQSINELSDKQLITEEVKDLALKQSNIDRLSDISKLENSLDEDNRSCQKTLPKLIKKFFDIFKAAVFSTLVVILSEKFCRVVFYNCLHINLFAKQQSIGYIIAMSIFLTIMFLYYANRPNEELKFETVICKLKNYFKNTKEKKHDNKYDKIV